MEDVLERAQSLIAGYDDQLVRELPEGAEIFDAHVHLGHDIDGMTGVYEDLDRINERYGISRCFMFCMDEVDRHPAFRAANDRSLAYAERSAGRLIPFVRLDLSEEPIDEATRCLDLGARGIKLHPRAQRFLLNDERLAPVFELAADRNVPILIHGGRGLPPIADHLHRLVERYPGSQLIIAHGGIADLGSLAGYFAGMAGVFFDTSVWSAIDLLSLYHLVSPEQVVYASDYPYGQQPSSLLISVRTARVAGLDDAQLRAMLSGTASRIAAGEPPLEPTPPIGDNTFAQPMAFARIHQYLSMATPALDEAGRHDRRARARAQRHRRPRRAQGGARADPRAARGGPRPLARAPGGRGRGRAADRQPHDASARPPRGHPGGDVRCLK